MESNIEKNQDPMIQAEIDHGSHGGYLETPAQHGDQDTFNGNIRQTPIIRPTVQRSDILEAQEDWLR